MKILVFAEQRDGKLKKASLEAMSVGRDLADATGGTAAAVLLGQGVELPRGGSRQGWRRKGLPGRRPAFREYSNDAYGLAAGKAAQALGAEALLFPGTAMGKDLAPKVTAAWASASCQTRPPYASSGAVTSPASHLLGQGFCHSRPPPGRPFAVTLRPNVFPVGTRAPRPVRSWRWITASPRATSRPSSRRSSRRRVECSTWPRPTSSSRGGRGLKGPENLPDPGGAGQGARRRGGRIPRGRGRGLDRTLAPGRPDRQGGEPRPLHRLRHLGRHPAPGGHVQLQGHRGRSTRTPKRPSSRWPPTASWATCSKSCPCSPKP